MESHWQGLRTQADQLASETRHAMYRDRGPAPEIALGAILENVRHPNTLTLSVVGGAVVGLLFWIWNCVAPRKEISELTIRTGANGGQHNDDIVCLPNRHWLRTKQPWRVSARRLALAAMAVVLIVLA